MRMCWSLDPQPDNGNCSVYSLEDASLFVVALMQEFLRT